MPMCNRRELLIRAGLARPPMISAEQKAEFVAQCVGFAVVTERSRIREAVSFVTMEIAVLSATIAAELWDGAE